MSIVKKQTYDNTYFFSDKGEMNRHHKEIVKFIMESARIDNKSSEAFAGVVNDVKRNQTSSILYTLLMRSDIVLCIANTEMPRAFKVFSAKDMKSDGTPKVFIDVTNVIVYNTAQGYYICKDLGKLSTYLFEALAWLLYDRDTNSFTSNSNITISATEAFVGLCDYLIGYFRFFGYSENRAKVNYLCALYFLVRIMGKEDDTYSKNLAAKVSGIAPNIAKNMDLFYDVDKDFININTFISKIADIFKFKGLTTEVFIAKWIYIYGEGTQYATELLPAFCSMIIAAYTGSYVVNQKSIEKQIPNAEVKLATSILKLGSDTFEKKALYSYESAELDYNYREDDILKRAKIMEAKKYNPDFLLVNEDKDFEDIDGFKNKVTDIINHYAGIKEEDKIFDKICEMSEVYLNKYLTEEGITSYDEGYLPTMISMSKKFITKNPNKSKLVSLFESKKNTCLELGDKAVLENRDGYIKANCDELFTEINECLDTIN